MPIRYVQSLLISADGAGTVVELENPGTYNIQIVGTFGVSTTIALQEALLNETGLFRTAVNPYDNQPLVVTAQSNIFEIKGGRFYRLFATSYSGSSNLRAIITLADR